MEQVVIFGGVNLIGQIIAKQLLTNGLKVVVFSDKVNEHKIIHTNYTHVKGDVFNIYAVNNVIDNKSAVISVYSYYDLWKMLYLSDPVENIIKSMNLVNSDRLLFFSFSEKIMPNHNIENGHLVLNKLFSFSYEDRMKKFIENTIKKSSLNFTLNKLDMEFLKYHSGKGEREQLLLYYRFVAEKVKNQILSGTYANEEVDLKFKLESALV